MAGLASALATYCVNTSYKAISDVRVSIENPDCGCERKCIRKLGKAELGMYYYSEFSDGTIGCVVRLSSQQDLKNSAWRTKFADVIQSYPILNMGIGPCETSSAAVTENMKDETLYFKQLSTPEVLKQLIRFHRDKHSFPSITELLHHSFSRQTRQPNTVAANSNSSSSCRSSVLWRVHVLHEYDSDRNMHYYTLGICFSHCIVDGTSTAILLQHLLASLNGNISSISSSSSIPPPIEKQVAFTYLPWPVEQISDVAIKAIIRTRLKPWTYIGSMRKYLKAFPPPIIPEEGAEDDTHEENGAVSSGGVSSFQTSSHPSSQSSVCALPELEKRETVVKVLKLSQKETAYFLRRCKQQSCSVTAALLTAASLAMSSLVQGGNLVQNVEILTDVTVDLRKYMVREASRKGTGDKEAEEFARQVFCATPLATITVKSSLGKINNKALFKNFWFKARLASLSIESRMKSGEVLRSWNLRQKLFCDRDSASTLMRMALNDAEGFGRYHHLLLTNLGNVDISTCSNPSSGGVCLEDIQFGVSGTVLGNIFMNYVATINGQLIWNMCYFDHITHHTDAETFISLVRDTIVRFAIAPLK